MPSASDRTRLLLYRRKPYEDVPKTLHRIAEEIERGHYGDVGCAVVALADCGEGRRGVTVFGLGEDSDAPTVVTLLGVAQLRLLRNLEEL